MKSVELFHESCTDALREVVQAAGGFKVVGVRLKPERSPEAAARWLHDCFNDAKAERLAPDQVLLILRLGREVGVHGAMNYFLREAGYHDAVALDPEDEAAQLQRAFIDSVAVQKRIADRLERLGALPPVLRVAGGAP